MEEYLQGGLFQVLNEPPDVTLPGGADPPRMAILPGAMPGAGVLHEQPQFAASFYLENHMALNDQWGVRVFLMFHFIFIKKCLCGEKMLYYLLLRESDSLALLRDREITLSSEYSKEMK